MYLTQGLHRSVQQTPDAIMTACGDRIAILPLTAHRSAEFVAALPPSGAGKMLERELRKAYRPDVDRQVH